MGAISKAKLQAICVQLGRRCSPKLLASIESALNYVETGSWFAHEGFEPRIVPTHWAVQDEIIKRIAERRVLYLEFGVWQGETMRYWSQRLTNPRSELHGFDSFEGLPDNWGKFEKGTFSTNGHLPEIADERVRFFKGWFEETLPGYELPPHDTLVINIDSDLYMSARYVLKMLREAILPGTYLYFDELCVRQDELRAFREFLSDTGMKFRAVAAVPSLRAAAFSRVG